MQTHTPFSAQTLSKKLIKPFLKIYADGRCSWRTGRSTPWSAAALWAVGYGPYPPRETAGDRLVSSNRYACPRFTLVSNHSPYSTAPGHPSSALSQPRGASGAVVQTDGGRGCGPVEFRWHPTLLTQMGYGHVLSESHRHSKRMWGYGMMSGCHQEYQNAARSEGHNGHRGRRNPI